MIQSTDTYTRSWEYLKQLRELIDTDNISISYGNLDIESAGLIRQSIDNGIHKILKSSKSESVLNYINILAKRNTTTSIDIDFTKLGDSSSMIRNRLKDTIIKRRSETQKVVLSPRQYY